MKDKHFKTHVWSKVPLPLQSAFLQSAIFITSSTILQCVPAVSEILGFFTLLWLDKELDDQLKVETVPIITSGWRGCVINSSFFVVECLIQTRTERFYYFMVAPISMSRVKLACESSAQRQSSIELGTYPDPDISKIMQFVCSLY